MTALIIGGGIAGAVTAMALHKAGVDATVYEGHPAGADDIGAFLTIMSNGMDALRAVDLEQPVADASFAATSVSVLDHTGTELEHRPLAGPARTLTRASLYRTLHDELVGRGGRIEHGKRLVDATVGADGVTATFGDGSSAHGDLLVGADGIHSTVRRLIDPGAPTPRYVGLHIYYGFAARGAYRAASAGYRMIFGGSAFFGYTTAPDGETWWFARLSGDELTDAELAAGTPARHRRRVLDAVAGDDTPAAEIVAATGDRIQCRNAYDIPTTPRWHAERMVLAGDAAHAASPAAGQGASMAIEDAVVLGKCLRDVPAHALSTYERLRRERTEGLVAASAKLAGRRADRPDWQREHHIDWHTPVEPR